MAEPLTPEEIGKRVVEEARKKQDLSKEEAGMIESFAAVIGGKALSAKKRIKEEKKQEEIKEVKKAIKPFFSFLNEKTPVGPTNRFDQFLEKVNRLQREVIGLRAGNFEVIEYESGKKCLYDAFFRVMDNFDLWSAMVSERPSLKASQRLIAIFFPITFPLLYLRMRFIYAYLSKRILGMYDLQDKAFIPYGEIRIIPPNIKRLAEKRDSDLQMLEEYVVLHENIHNLQALNFPIEKYRKESVKELFEKRGSPQLEKLQVLMTVIEGHAEFFTDKLAKAFWPKLRFRKKRNLRQRLISKILGMGAKAEQYEVGSNFIRCLYQKGGSALANLPFENSPLSMKEIKNPEEYIKRVAQ